MALAVPPLSLTPQAPAQLSPFVCLSLFSPAVSFCDGKDQGKTDLKPNKTTKPTVFCLFTLLNQFIVGPAVGGSTSQGRMGIPRTGRAGSA